MFRTRSFAAVIAAAAVMVLAAPAPAYAAKPYIEHWEFHDEHIEQVEHAEDDPPWCPDLEFDVLFTEDAWGTFLFQQRGDGMYYGGGPYTSEISWTNVENGKTFSAIRHGTDKDHEVTQNVDENGDPDGTITITVLNAGVTTYYDDEDNRLFVDAGRNFFSLVIDVNGTPENPEDDEFVEFIGFDAKGNFETADRDFCADLQEYIG